jgi:tRNA threonylcarbamoyladenosine biosynthesis protein TsaE
MQWEIRNLDELKSLTIQIIDKLLVRYQNKPLVIGLVGELGAGKTTLVRFLASYLGIQNQIASPTFLIIKEYALPRSIRGKNALLHIDAYRVVGVDELTNLNFIEEVSDPQKIIIVEWAERIKKIMSQETIWLSITVGSEGERLLTTEHTL